MTGVEIDFVVTDCIAALELYESIFEAQRIEVTELEKGHNEAVFTIYGARIHMLDENPDFQLVAPKDGDPKPMWLNVLVPDIEDTFNKAISLGCTEVMPITKMEAMGATNAMFKDTFGYLWLLHQIHREVSFEDRLKAMSGNAEIPTETAI